MPAPIPCDAPVTIAVFPVWITISLARIQEGSEKAGGVSDQDHVRPIASLWNEDREVAQRFTTLMSS